MKKAKKTKNPHDVIADKSEKIWLMLRKTQPDLAVMSCLAAAVQIIRSANRCSQREALHAMSALLQGVIASEEIRARTTAESINSKTAN